jgi:hypothetical protein
MTWAEHAAQMGEAAVFVRNLEEKITLQAPRLIQGIMLK